MKHALIDYGSNSVRVAIYEVTREPLALTTLWTKKTMAGLVGYLNEAGELSQAGIDRSCDILNHYKKRLEADRDIVSTSIFATAVLRRAKNRDAVMAQIAARTGYAIDLLSGEEEARCGFLGALWSLPLEEGVQIDIGGSSTEVVFFKDRAIVEAASLPLGSLSCYLEHVSNLIPTMRESDDIREHLMDELARYPGLGGVAARELTVVGGTGRAISKLADAWYHNNVHEKRPVLTRIRLDDILRRAYYDPTHVVREVLQIVPERVHTVFPGAIILDQLASVFGAQRAPIASYGVREGYLLSRVLGVAGAPNEARCIDVPAV